MNQVVFEIVRRGIAASLLVLMVVLLRLCFKRMPKWVRLVLWGLVAVRLLCPVSLETSFSLIPDVVKIFRTVEETKETPEQQTAPNINSYIQEDKSPVIADVEDFITDKESVDIEVNISEVVPDFETMPAVNNTPVANNTPADVVESSIASPEINMAESSEDVAEEPSLLVIVWMAGMLLLAIYGVVSYLKVKHQVKASWNARENIFYCDDIDTPFVFGLIKPGIYLPSGIEAETEEYVLHHEKQHLRRGDQWWKVFGFLLLSVYWFHSLLWVAYVLFCKDIEFACDERVIRELGEEKRREYAQALLRFSIGKRIILLCPTAFGINDIKSRIRSVMAYRKATIPVLIGVAVLCLVVAAVFLTDRKDPYGIDAEDIVLDEVTLDNDVAEDIAEDIAALMSEAGEDVYRLENFKFTFYNLNSTQGNQLFRVSVEADKTSLRAPEDSPVIAGMKKAQSELTYEAERKYAQTMIDSMLSQLRQEAELRICEPVIFVTVDAKNRYELYYGDAKRTPLTEYFKKEDAEQEELLGYLSVYQKANVEPPIDATGNYGYWYVDALENPERKTVGFGSKVNSVNLNNSFLYYKECAYDDIAVYQVKEKEKLPWELLGEEIKTVYSNNGQYWSERNALVECTGESTVYRVNGYEDTYRVAIVYEQNWWNEDYAEQQLVSTGIRMGSIFQSVIGQAKEEEIWPDRTTYHMVICEHMNGLWFHEGREVFRQRMHLENAVSVNGLSMEEELLWNFLAELNAATFAPVTTRGLVNYETIIFTDAHGMEHSLKLYETGYVQVQACEKSLYAKIDEGIALRVIERVRAYKAQQPFVSMEDVFPIEKVFAKEEGYETLYEALLELAKAQLFDKNIPTAWFGETGYYISKVPVYYCGGSKVSESVNVLYLSKDFSKSDAASVGWDIYEEPIVSSGSFDYHLLELMKENPSEEYIVVSGLLDNGLPDIALLAADNSLHGLAPMRQFILMKEDNLYQKLYSDELAVSYEELTDKENLIWISVTEGAEITAPTPTPTPTPVDISRRTYQTSYEMSPYAAYSAEDWLKSGHLKLPFERKDMLNAQQMSERYAMYYIPMEALRQATTVDLVQVAAFDYPFGAYGNYPSIYLECARDKFNAFDALFAREDMVDALLKVYEANGFYLELSNSSTERKKEAFRQEEGIVLLEIMLATDEAFEKMQGKQEMVLQAVSYKMELRKLGRYVAEEKVCGFFAYIKENALLGNKWYDYIMEYHADDEELLSYLENAMYPGDNIPVSPMRPEDVYNPTRIPASEEDELLHTLRLSLMGKECSLQIIGKKTDTDIWGVREVLVYAGDTLIQTISMQEAILADGVDGIEKGYTCCDFLTAIASLKDVNFDDYLDLEVFGWCPNNSIPYYYWCWNPETQQFEYAFTLQLTDVDEERKQLVSWKKTDGGTYYTERYRVTADNKLELAERMTEEYWTNTYADWKDAYLHVIDCFPDNMIDPYGFRDNSDWEKERKYVYLGIHDFDADDTPELIIGDSASLAVFTYKNGKAEKCTDIVMQCCWQCIDEVVYHDNAILASCSGSSSIGHVTVAWRDGKWVTAIDCGNCGNLSVNGTVVTREKFSEVNPFDVDNRKDTVLPYKNGWRDYWKCLVKENGNWYIEYPTYQAPLNEYFDFETIRWTEN